MFERQFHLDRDVLGPKSAESVVASVLEDPDVERALLADQPFPVRPSGKLELGTISLRADGANRISFSAGAASVDFSFSASFQTGIGIYDRAADVLAAFPLNSMPALDLAAGGEAGCRYIVMLAAAKVQGSAAGSHPIGLLQSVSIAVSASGDLVFGVIHRFRAADGAATVLAEMLADWHLPRDISGPGDLAPGTWIISEADGAIEFTAGTRLGYDFNFVRHARLLGTTRELGAKIDAGLQASIGFAASGRYLMVVGRESDAPIVRVRLQKQSGEGWHFGLELKVGVTARVTPPPGIDDLVKAIFGVHARQVLKDLRLLEQWTDPTSDLVGTAARLTGATGLDLLTAASGIDARSNFEAARQAVLRALAEWGALRTNEVIQNIEDFIGARLDLGGVLKAITKNDFERLDPWLILRLSDFVDKQLSFSDLNELQSAINGIIAKLPQIWDAALNAAQNRYSEAFSASYQRNTSEDALLDAAFDLSVPAAAAMLREVVAESRLDDLLANPPAGVMLNHAALSHEIDRRVDVQFHMPFLDSEVEHVTQSLAALTVEHHAGGVLAYQLDAKDTVTAKNRYQSQLAVIGTVAGSDRRIGYQTLLVKSGMKLDELRSRTREFLETMLSSTFPDADALDRFYAALALGDKLGDAGINLQVSLPASILDAWFRAVDVGTASMNLSQALQARLKQLIPILYFEDTQLLQPNETAAALLVWSALPLSSEMPSSGAAADIFWDYRDGELLRAAVFSSVTRARLMTALASAQQRITQAGDSRRAQFFVPSQASRFQQMALTEMGATLLQSLLVTEAQVVTGAVQALKDVQQALARAGTQPSAAIPYLAEFGAHLTETFNRHLSVYCNESTRALNSMLLIEASRALDPAAAAAVPRAMFSLVVLKNGHAFPLPDYLQGKYPPISEIAFAQTVANTGPSF